jgi:polyisoprenyl-teichoic acid--peptidoglycan teichoic acid transferase
VSAQPEEPKIPRLGRRMWLKFMLGGTLIVLLVGAATATAGLLEVKDVAEALNQNRRLKISELTPAEAGAPQTILLLGSDVRRDDIVNKRPGRSDTMMLVRLDPNKEATAALSIPRDLRVTYRLPNGNMTTDKLNSTYTYGGPKLVVKTLSNLLGVPINHVVDVNFRGFREAVDFIGCVFVDVDRKYFNDNSGGGPLYATIDIEPGYQKLCGQDALDYVRFRHEDDDFVRAARQQSFLRDAKSQVGVQKVLEDRKEFARLFGKYATTDIRGTSDVLSLFKLVAFSAGRPVRQVKFQAGTATIGGGSYVIATPEQIRKAVDEFKNPAPPPASRQGTKRTKKKAEAKGLEDAKTSGEDQAIAAAPEVDFPVYFPGRRLAGSSYSSDSPRTYVLKDEDGKRHDAYRLVLSNGVVGDYYGVQGTTWKDPPILEKPSATQVTNGKKLLLYKDGSRLALVAWKTPRASYWISNTLQRTLSNKQMVAIAASLQRLGK